MSLIKQHLYQQQRTMDQLIITKAERRMDAIGYVEDIWVTNSDHDSDPVFIIDSCGSDYQYSVLSRKDDTYCITFTAQTVCECKEFIEDWINNEITQKILKLSPV